METVGDCTPTKEKSCTEIFKGHKITVIRPSLQAKNSCSSDTKFVFMISANMYDVIIIGGGPIGLATAYEVAKAGASALVLEQNNFFNQAGSSNDLARMFRTM